jgi:hypothetical protein
MAFSKRSNISTRNLADFDNADGPLWFSSLFLSLSSLTVVNRSSRVRLDIIRAFSCGPASWFSGLARTSFAAWRYNFPSSVRADNACSSMAVDWYIFGCDVDDIFEALGDPIGRKIGNERQSVVELNRENHGADTALDSFEV